MNEHISRILAQMAALDDELRQRLVASLDPAYLVAVSTQVALDDLGHDRLILDHEDARGGCHEGGSGVDSTLDHGASVRPTSYIVLTATSGLGRVLTRAAEVGRFEE